MRTAASLCLALWLSCGCTPAERTPLVGPVVKRADARRRACEPPALIVQITVDQLRGDLVARYLERFGEGGFRRFVEQGLWYRAAHYRHAITETAPGHATLATGADPRAHGIVANQWLDPVSGELVYNSGDPDHPLVGVDAQGVGRSSHLLRLPTTADQLVTGSGGRARAYALSIKDRGAILPAGRLGRAFWFDKATGRFVTSTAYAEALPAWVADFNAREPWRRFAGASWTLSGEAGSYVFGDQDSQPWEGGAAGWGNTFPHAYGEPDEPGFFGRVVDSPAGDALLFELVKALFEAEPLGQRDGVTDYLSVSFSATDYVGHAWGPSSLESEDNLRRLDALLAELLSWLDAQVGLERTLVVLSADHGVGEVPALRAQQGFAAQQLSMETFDFAAVDAHLAEQGVHEKLYGALHAPYVWLDAEAVERAGLEAGDALELLAAAFVRATGVHAAYTREQLGDDEPADDPLLERARRSYFAGRSGDLHLVPDPYTLLSLYPGGVGGLTASHGTPWAYDTHVPILALGAGVPQGRVARPVGPHTIAPTLTLRAGAPMPAGAVGEVLDEVVSCQ